MAKHTHLTQDQRYQIQAWSKAGWYQTQMAEQLGCSQSTISRELKRNGCKQGYSAGKAEQTCRQRHKNKPKQRKHWEVLDVWIGTYLEQGWTPERIAVESRQAKPHGMSVSHEWIYLRLRDDAKRGGNLWRYLPRARKKRKPRLPKADRRGGIRNRVSISERPKEVEDRSTLGNWEIDTVVSAGKQSAVVTALERKSRLYLAMFVESRDAKSVGDALVTMLQPYALQGKVITITADNGREFAGHEQIAAQLKCSVYFADPYSSYQRGGNEHHNGLLRRFYPKGTDFATVSESQLRDAVTKINLWPRKCLGWRRPIDMINEA